MSKTYYTNCDAWPSDPMIVVNINLDTNWACEVGNPSHNFPIYKPCCHFYEINADGSCRNEVNFQEHLPIILT